MKGGSFKMKRTLFIYAAVCLLVCGLTACGDSNENSQPAAAQSGAADQSTSEQSKADSAEAPDPDAIMLTLHDGAVVPITDKSSVLRETEDGYLWNFHDGDCSISFPKSWESRFIIRGNTVYSLMCFERAEAASSLFTIEFRNAEEVAASPVPSQIIGFIDDTYICVVNSSGFEPENAVLRREYRMLTNECSGILQTFECTQNSKFSPIALNDYMSATSCESPLHKTWKIQTARNGKLEEQIRFHSDGTLTYSSDGTTLKGSWLVNVYSLTYDWTQQSNWGAAAIVFLDNKIYEATYYETRPQRLDFSAVFLPDNSHDLFGSSTYTAVD